MILNPHENKAGRECNERFFRKPENYLLCQSRMDALSVIATWEGSITRLQREKEEAQAEKEQAKQAAEQAQAEKEQALKQAQAEKENYYCC